MEEKNCTFRFEEHTLQVTMKITLNTQMQSSVNCVTEAESLGQDPGVSLYDYIKGLGMFVGKFDILP